MLKTRMAHRVAVHRGAAVFYHAPASAEHLLASGLAVIRKRRKNMIMELEFTDLAVGYRQGLVAANRLGVKAGSMGIRVEGLPSGHRLFQHRNSWDQVHQRTKE